jgi:hypothetical protein
MPAKIDLPRLIFTMLIAFQSWVAAAAPSDSVVVFNEIMYHPVAAGDDGEAAEWVEIYNQMGVDIDLSGWRLSGGIDFTFPDGSVIGGGSYLVVTSDQFEGKLSNGGETINLRDNSDRLMDSLAYRDTAPWPVGADGSGASLAKISPLRPSAEVANWRASPKVGGTPDAANFPLPGETVSTLLLDWVANWRFNETGTDAGAGWSTNAHAVGGDWGQGPGPLGWDSREPEIPIATRVTPPLQTPGVVTYYFETEFILTAAQSAGVRELQLIHLIDDGAVFYLNGTEIARFQMPGGAVDATTLALGDGDAIVSEAIIVSSDSLVVGENRLSVEVHQNSTLGSDIVFGTQLLMEFDEQSANASDASLVFNEISGAGEGDFRVELANPGAGAVSLNGYAIVSSTGGRFDFVGGNVEAGGFIVAGTDSLGFRPARGDRLFLFKPGGVELEDAREVTNRLRGRAGTVEGRWLFPSAASFGSANLFSFHEEVVINEIMYHARPAFPEEEVPATYMDETILVGSALWKYEQSGSLPGANWTAPGFDDSGWAAGQAALGVESGALPEPIRTGLILGQTTYYFRKSLTYSGDADVDRLRLRLQVDDGAVIYINGIEVLRVGMPAGTVDHETLAAAGVGNAEYGIFELPENPLVPGENIIAVEVHQSARNSSDIVFAMEVINGREISPGSPALPLTKSDEEWVELFNRSDIAVDLGGWELDGGLQFSFPAGTVIEPGEFLVVAADLGTFREVHPGIAALGEYSGGLGNRSDRIVLKDDDSNPADEVTYFDGGRWDGRADGYGPSLELQDPSADNSSGGAWLASDEGARSGWQTYTYRAIANTPVGGAPAIWQEFAFGMLHGEGEILIDDISVVEDPDGAAIERLQNGSFDGGSTTGWRLLGNHQRSFVENGALHVIASGATEYQGNQIETTFANGARIANGAEYEISFRARWLSGSSHLNARLYFNRAAVTTELEVPTGNGTPGAPNSRLQTNLGPTFDGLQHSPLLPKAGQPVTVSATARDPDGIGGATLYYRPDGGAWTSVTMTAGEGGRFTGLVPGRPAGSVVQFYVEATDLLGASSLLPANGEKARALFEVDDGVTAGGAIHDLRAIMLTSDSDLMHLGTNSLSNEILGATIIYQNETFYDAGIRLKGSFVGRDAARVGFNLKFNPDQLFRGIHGKVAIDRSTHGDLGVDEIIIKQIAVHAGDIPGMYDDIVQFIAPRSQHDRRALLRLAAFDDIYLDSQFENGSEGPVFEYEVYRWATTTIDGNPESPKRAGGLGAPNGYLNIPFSDLGDDKEDYRWHTLITNGRTGDDYGTIMPFLKAFSQTGADLEESAAQVMDLDSMMRTLAYQTLVGPGDSTFTGGADHNFRLYARPDGKVMYFPWDWDSAFLRSTSAPLVGGGRFATLVNRPVHLRLFYGHLKDIIEGAFNTEYMAGWTSHYGELGGQNFSNRLSYIGARANFVQSRLPAEIPFAITTNGGNNFAVSDPLVQLAGKGWIDVAEIHLAGRSEPLAVTWSDAESWTLEVPLIVGPNVIMLVAFDPGGNEVGRDTITVTNDGEIEAANAGNLAITELMYHPFEGGEEFVEIMNIGLRSIDLTGVRFTDGIDFAFAEGVTLLSGERLVVRDFAKETRLSNSGEQIILVAADGAIIREFTYLDRLPWPTAPDGAGPSLVLIAPLSNPDHGLARNWRSSVEAGGNPGTDDSSAFSGIPGADLDRNGIDDLLDYALGNSPGSADGLPMPDSSGGRFSVSYTRKLGADDVAATPEFSTDLANWSAVDDVFTLVGITPIGSGRERVVMELSQSLATPEGIFFRLKTSLR